MSKNHWDEKIWLNNTTIMCFIWWLSLSHLWGHPTGCQWFCNVGGNSRLSPVQGEHPAVWTNWDCPIFIFHQCLASIQHQSLFLFDCFGEVSLNYIFSFTAASPIEVFSKTLIIFKWSLKRNLGYSKFRCPNVTSHTTNSQCLLITGCTHSMQVDIKLPVG